jgi:Beta-lactamase enzyme family
VTSAAAPAFAAPPSTWQSRVSSAVRYTETRSGMVGFAVVDEAGRLRGYRAGAVAPAASILKPMLLVAYLRRADVRGRELRPWERDLLAPMIRRSDDAAAVRMIGLVGERRLSRLARLAGMDHFRFHWPDWGRSEITPRGQARFFYLIDSLLPARHRAYALRLLAAVVPSQGWGVGRVAHRGWRLHFKGGWSSGTGLVDHQVALYTAAGERFSLALFTRFNPSHEYGKETLRGLAGRLLTGIPHPLAAGPRAARFAAEGGYVALAPSGCGSVALRALGGGTRTVSTAAMGCDGVALALAGGRTLWSRAGGGSTRLATASYADPAPVELGTFGPDDPLGALAGGEGTLAYAHGGVISTVGQSDCPSPNTAVAAGAGRVAGASGGTVELRDASSCALLRSLAPGGVVNALALDGDLLASLSTGDDGGKRVDVYRISTGARLAGAAVSGATIAALSLRGGRVAFRAPHALRALAVGSGRSWTLWRPRRAPVGSGLAGRRLAWSENGARAGRVWLLPLPGT